MQPEWIVQPESLVPEKRLMQTESMQAETELMVLFESGSMGQAEAVVWQAWIKLLVYTGKQR